MNLTPYRGRFAPTPSGPLHFGSLIAALGSYLDARAAGGEWLVRIEDIDTPRVARGAVTQILQQLEGFGLLWDGPVLYQSSRFDAYEQALQQLKEAGWVYPCNCTRTQINALARIGLEGPVYPGTCRHGLRNPQDSVAWRLQTPVDPVDCYDRLQGETRFNLAQDFGDFVLKRADGIYAYQLAVVVDDAAQGINNIVRGADLWLSTPRQQWLQQCLSLPTPQYLHLPLVLNQDGEKLSKQTLAPAINPQAASQLLWQALVFLGQQPPAEISTAAISDILGWGIQHWSVDLIPKLGGEIGKSPLV